MRVNTSLVAAVIFAGLVSTVQSASDRGAYRMGVFPYLSTIRLETVFAPIAAELATEIDHPVIFNTASTFELFQSNLARGRYDIAIIPPFLYPFAVDQHDYIALLKVEEPLFSLILVTENSRLTRLDELRGKVIAIPPANGPVVELARRKMLENGIDPARDVILKTTRSVSSCLQQVVLQTADACVAPSFAQRSFEESMKVKLKALMRSRASPNRVLVVHMRLEQQSRNRIRRTFLSWRHSARGKRLMSAMSTRGFVEVDDSEFDFLRRISAQPGD